MNKQQKQVIKYIKEAREVVENYVRDVESRTGVVVGFSEIIRVAKLLQKEHHA